MLYLFTIALCGFLVAGEAPLQDRQGWVKDKHGHLVFPVIDEKTGSVRDIHGLRDSVQLFGIKPEALSEETVRQLGKSIFMDFYDILQVDSTQLIERSIDRRGIFWHGRYRQQYKGIEVYGTDIGFTIANGNLRSLGARMYPGVNLPTTIPTETPEQAVRMALADFQPVADTTVSVPVLRVLCQENDEGVIGYHLVWMLDLAGQSESERFEGYRYFFDALAGEIVRKSSNSRH